jgi:predicted CXXCH cytochrome family protein
LIALHKDGKHDGKAPEPLTADKAKYGITCTTCHDPHSEAGQPANLVQEPYALCVSCHSNSTVEKGIHHPVQEMYEGISLIPNITGIPDSHFVDAKGPRCQTCHLPQTPTDTTTRASHTFKPVLPGVALTVNGLNDSCLSCHRKEVDGASMQKLIDDVQNSVRARLKAARAAVRENTPAWVTQALDFVEGDGSLGIHNYRYADAILDAVDTALGLTPATVSR